MRKRSWKRMLAAATAAAVIFTGTVMAPLSARAASDSVITSGFTSGWSTLMPYDGSAGNLADLIFDKIYDRLAYVNVEGEVSPRAADSWEWSDDNLTATFHLNPDAAWHDGEPVTANDWVFTFQTMSKSEVVTPRQAMLAIFEGTDDSGVETAENSIGVEATDDTTLVLHFKEPIGQKAFFTARNMYYYVLPEHLLKDVALEDFIKDDYFSSPIGSGPLMFESETTGNTLTLKANENYQLGAPGFGTLVYQVVQANNILSSMASGTLDNCFFALTQDDCDMVEAMYSDTLELSVTSESSMLCALTMNTTKLTNKEFRQAVNMAIDKETITATALRGEGTAAESFLQQSSEYVDKDLTVNYDPEGAKALLEESGFDTSTTLKLAYQAGGFTDSTAALIQENLAAIGLNVELQTTDLATTVSGIKDGTYDMAIFKFPVIVDPVTAENYFGTSGTNICSITDEEGILTGYYDTLYSSTDEDARMEAATGLQTYYHDEMPFAPIFHYSGFTAHTKTTHIETGADTALLNEACWEWTKE